MAVRMHCDAPDARVDTPTPLSLRNVVVFGSGRLDVPGLVPRRGIAGVIEVAPEIRALVIDARHPDDFARAHALLRALYDDPRRARRLVHPARVLAVIADGDVEAAFTLGRYGIAGVIEERALAELRPRLARALRTEIDPVALAVPALAPPRPTHLGPRPEDALPTVTLAYRHAPDTLDALARYVRTLRAHASESTVFADVATLLEVMVAEDLTCQTNLAAKAGATHTGQFIGAFEFYRELRRTRYARIPEHPSRAIDMDVLIAVDEILHEVLHLLYLANVLRAGVRAEQTLIAEELSLTWWQGLVHARVFPEWLADRPILEINDDFMLQEKNEIARGFWDVGTVFESCAVYPWVPHVLARLPARASYIGERSDLDEVIGAWSSRPDAAFLLRDGGARLRVPVPFDSYPAVPAAMRVS